MRPNIRPSTRLDRISAWLYMNSPWWVVRLYRRAKGWDS